MKRKTIFIILVSMFLATLLVFGFTNARYSYSANTKGNMDLLQTKCSLELYNPSSVTGSTSGATYKTENGTSYFAVPSIPTDYTNINYKVNNKVSNVINQKEIQYYIRVVAEDGSTNMPIEYNVHKYNDASSKYSLVSGWGYGPFTLQKNTEYSGTDGMFSIEANFTSMNTKYLGSVQKMKVQMVTKLSTGSLKVLSEAPLNMKANWPSYKLTVNNQNTKYGTISGTSSGNIKYTDNVTVTATPNTYYVFAGWKDNDTEKIISSSTTYTFTMPAKDVNITATYSFDITQIKNIKVLNVYPNAGNSLQSWMNSYGQWKISVTPVSITDYNNNPDNYLKSNGSYKYDVLIFGFWDSNNGYDLSTASRDATENFIKTGRSVIFGHDTLAMVTNSSTLYHPNFGYLSKYVNITHTGEWTSNRDSKIKIVKEGIVTQYPYNIGTINTILTIPVTHNLDQVANGDIWVTFNNNVQTGKRNFYFTTYQNRAMIQTGDSSGQATADEQKLIANFIFYVYSYDLMNNR